MSVEIVQKYRYHKNNIFPKRLIDFLTQRFPYFTKAQWKAKIITQKIQVNQQPTTNNYNLKNLDIISYIRDVADEPKVNDKIEIINDNKDIVVVNKNGQLPVSISGRYYYNTLIEKLKTKNKGYEILYPVHRIDKETSGIVVLAKNKKTAIKLGNQFSKGEQIKLYHAVLIGELPKKEVIIEKPIAKNNGSSLIHIRQVCKDQGKSAKTRFTRLKTNKGYSLVEIQTFTGRTHQIRCHAEEIGYPLVGDKLYGQKDKIFLDYVSGKRDIFKGKKFPYTLRQLLHASLLSFNLNKEQLIYKNNPISEFNQQVDFKKIFPNAKYIFNKSIDNFEQQIKTKN